MVLLPVTYFKGTDFKPAKRLPLQDRAYWNNWGKCREQDERNIFFQTAFEEHIRAGSHRTRQGEQRSHISLKMSLFLIVGSS